MAIQIGKYKRPGIFIEEIDKSIITSPPVTGPIPNLIMGFSRKGPVNSAVLITNLSDLETVFGSLDRQLERKGSYFHRTISKMLEAGPVFAVNLLVTDDNLDTVEYQSVSTTTQYKNDIERIDSFRKFFDTTGFWKRDTETFIDLTVGNPNYSQRLLNLVNLGDRYISVFIVKSQVSGFDRALLEWYGSIEKLPPYVYPTDLASDYLVDVVVVGGDWSNYASLSEDPRWQQYFAATGLKKTEIRNFANDRNITTLAYYEGVSLIPYFRDLNGRNVFIETVINRDTDRTGLFCAYNNNLVEGDYPTGKMDLIGNSLVSDNLLSNPPSLTETYYQSLDKNDTREDGEIRVNFLSYNQQITETVSFTNRVLDRAGNVTAIFGTNSAIKSRSGSLNPAGTFTHSFNDDGSVFGGVVSGPNDDTNLSYVAYPNRTYWFTEGYVNDLYRVGGLTVTTQSVSLNYRVNPTSDNGYAVIGGNRVGLSGTYSISLSNLDYPQIKTASGTQSYNIAFVLTSNGTIDAKKTNAQVTKPRVSATDIVLGWGTVSVYGGNFVTFSGAYAATLQDVTVGLTTSTSGGGSDAYIPLVYGVDYQFSTQSTPALPLGTGDFKVEFLNTNSTPDLTNYEQYRRIKLFNNVLTYVNSSNTSRGLMLLDPQGTTTKKSLAEVRFGSFETGTTVNKSFAVSTGLSASDISSILSSGELVFYKLDDEFLIDFAGFETKNTLPALIPGSTQSMGVVGKFSSFYTQFDQGNISTGDAFFQNNIYDNVEVQFVPGAGVTASLAGYNYIIFKVDQTKTYQANNDLFFAEINDLIGSEAVDEFSTDVEGYKFLIGGLLNDGVFTTVYDRGLSPQNSLTSPDGADGDGTLAAGRAYLLYNYSNGVIDSLNTNTFSYYAYEIVEDVVEETVEISRLYGYSQTQNDNELADKPLYLAPYTKTNGDLVVNFVDFSLATQSYLGTLASGNSALATNGTIFVKSQVGNFKQTIEIESPTGWVEKPNVILIRRARYGEVRVGDYLEASYDATILRADEMPKKLTRILSKKLWVGDGNYVEIATDAPIKVRTFGTDRQTMRYTKIDDLVSTYQAISLKGFRLREAQMPDGTDTRQNTILDVVKKGTNLYKALINKEAFDFRYLIDSFGLGLTSDSKQNLVDLIGDRLDAFGILNMPSLRQFKNSVNPSFKDSLGNVQMEYVALGGNPNSNPNFLYSFGKGKGVTSVGYFLPYVQVDDFGRIIEIPPSAYVGLTFMRKHTSTSTSITPWTIAAGVNNGRIEGILDLEQIFSYSDLEFLNQAQMNPLTFKRNRGFVIETENTAQVLVKSALSLIHVREVLIELERELSRMLLDFQWTFNTPEIRAAIKLQADVICEKYVAQGGLFNYFNKIDEENNTLEIIDNQIGVIDTYVEPIKGMGIIVNNITILRTGAISAGGFINS